MQELLYEETAVLRNVGSAKTKFYVFKTFSIISYVLTVLWLIFFISFFKFEGNFWLNLIISLLPMALFLASGIMLGKFKDRFYVDYDYVFVSGSIRFSKVIKNYKRRKICNFECSDIERIGKYGSETFEKYSKMPNLKPNVLTSNMEPDEGKDFYYIVANVDEDRKLYILECTEMLIVNIMKYSKRTILDEAMKK